ncbi:MAG: hypothetical protein JSV09_04100 [Thermoplasmata archaeon]|nr:MAG: hypothetical protein JSV09_04100 [Thermoplasmata archaeon]
MIGGKNNTCSKIRWISILIIPFILVNIGFLDIVCFNSQASQPKNPIPIFAGLSGDNVIILDDFEIIKFDMEGNKIWKIDTDVYSGLLTSNSTTLVGSHKRVYVFDGNGNNRFKRPFGIGYYTLSNDGSVIYEIRTSTFLNNNGKTLFTQNKNESGLPQLYSISGDGLTFVRTTPFNFGMVSRLNALHIAGTTWECRIFATLKSMAVSYNGSDIFLGTTRGLYRFERHSTEFNYSEEEYIVIEYLLYIDDISISDDGYIVAAKTEEGIYFLKNMALQDKNFQGDLVSISPDGQTILIIDNLKLFMYDNNLTLLWESHKLSRNGVHYNNDISIINGDSIVLVITEGYISVFDKMGNELWNYKGKHDIYDFENNESLCFILPLIIILTIPPIIIWRIKKFNKNQKNR